MKKCAFVLILVCLCSTGCTPFWRNAGPRIPAVQYPIIPLEEYPDYTIPAKIETEEEKGQIVEAVFLAERHAQLLRKRIEIYNAFAKGKNSQAEELFK